MIYLIILLIILYFINPYIDMFRDYRGKKHMIIWYNNIITNERKYYQLY